MCKCTPEIRTPFCGKPGCEWPQPTAVYKPFDGRLRLGFTGAGGTGKGTLAKKVADKLGLTFLPTPLTEIGRRFGMLDFKDHRGQEDAIAYQFAALHAQIYQEKGLRLAGLGYIAERTSLDYIPYYVQKVKLKTLDHVYQQTAFRWAEDAYTMIIYCPLEFEPQDGEAWKERDQADRQKTDTILCSWLNRIQTVVPVITVTGSITDRYNQIFDALDDYIKRACPNLCER
jgi:nicotinamide riboside kinase